MKIYVDTNIGNRRSSNQDTYRYNVISDNLAWSVVCDGMGGVNGGDIASNTAADTIEAIIQNTLTDSLSESEIKELMIHAANEANSAVFSKAFDNLELKGMGTTVVLSIVKGNQLYLLHVGDSRAYIYKDSRTVQVTEDHSYVQDLVNRGEITKEEARVHPHKNIITRSLGVHSMVETDFSLLEIKSGEILVVCSDGLSDYLTEELLSEYLNKYKEEDIINGLIEYALHCGGNDNITVLTLYR